MSEIINTKELSVGYNKSALIDNIEISVKQGEILVLIGPNGAGKSTILKTLSKQLEQICGTVFLKGEDMTKLSDSYISKEMALVMTSHPSPEYMTVEEMVQTGRYPYTGRFGFLSEEDRKIVEKTILTTGIEKIRDKDFNRISDGQRQKVMLARALCQEPEILIMDEPTSYLDIHHKIELLSILKKLVRERNIAVIMSLHELDFAQKCADNVLCIAEGAIDRYGSVEEIFHEEEGYIERLYGVKRGTYISEYGSVEMEKIEGNPKVFVIGGGGKGIPVYRKLQREGIPFAAGVLHENDVEYPVARALATEVVVEKSFEQISDEKIQRAKAIIDKCEKVLCTVDTWGMMNEKNRELKSYAKEKLSD
ncbi:MAG: ABC transporter ATP-binding protein [Lachnospiraceae bacterium]|nr:ABC transporter ATP-binding protein [Lachnospiraceae bacterium]